MIESEDVKETGTIAIDELVPVKEKEAAIAEAWL